MVEDVEKINDLYFSVLGLLIALAETAATDKKSDYKNFIGNLWIEAFATNPELKKFRWRPEIAPRGEEAARNR